MLAPPAQSLAAEQLTSHPHEVPHATPCAHEPIPVHVTMQLCGPHVTRSLHELSPSHSTMQSPAAPQLIGPPHAPAVHEMRHSVAPPQSTPPGHSPAAQPTMQPVPGGHTIWFVQLLSTHRNRQAFGVHAPPAAMHATGSQGGSPPSVAASSLAASSAGCRSDIGSNPMRPHPAATTSAITQRTR